MINVNQDSCQIVGDVIGVTEDIMNIVLSLTDMYGKEKTNTILNYVQAMNSEELFKVHN